MAIAPGEGPGLHMCKRYYESAPGVIRSTGEPAISRFWEAVDGSGMWRQGAAMGFWKSKEWQELSGLLTTAYLPGPTVGGQYLGLHSVPTPDGKLVLAAAVFDDIYPGSNFIEITDEKLLAKLRNIKGQFHDVPGTGDLPVFYYEFLMSTADFKVFSKTGRIPIVNRRERPEPYRLVEEMMELLIKRQASLADGIDALTRLMIDVLKDSYEGTRANELNLLCSDFYEEARRFSESMKTDRYCLIPREGFSEDATHVLIKPDRVSRLLAPVKRLQHRIGQALARGGTNLRNKLGQGGGPPERVRPLAIEISELLNNRRISRRDAFNGLNGVIITAIEATHGRGKSDKFDMLVARLCEGVGRLSG